MSNLLKDASILLTPTAYENGRMNATKPSKDLYGSELVTNGDFSNGTTGWSSPDYNSTLSILNGQMKIVSTISLGRVSQAITTEVGKKYLISATTTNIDSSTGIQIKVSNAANLDGATYSSEFNATTNPLTITHRFIATATTTYIGSSQGSSVGQSALLDNVSVVEDLTGDFDFQRNSAATRVNAQGLVENVQILSPELVSNGNFSEIGTEKVLNGNFSQEGSELAPASDFDDTGNFIIAPSSGTVSQSNGTITFDNATSTGAEVQLKNRSISTGKFYKIQFTVSNYSSGIFRMSVGNQTTDSVNANGTYTFYVEYKNGLARNYFYSSGSTLTVSNVSVKEVGQNWNLGNKWSIGENSAIRVPNSTSNLSQAISGISGKTIKVSYEVSNYVGGDIGASADGVSYNANNGNGTFVEYIKPTSDNFYLRASYNFEGSVTNISVKEVGQDWTLGTGFSIGENKAIVINSSNSNLQQVGITITNTKKYKINFTIADYTSGSIRPMLGAVGAVSGTFVSANGTYTEVLTANNNFDRFVFRTGGTAFNGSITNISLKEITDDTNIPRINYEGFSYQDVLGSELVVNGDFSSDSNWTKGTGWTISGGTANCDGSQSSQSNLYQTGIVPINKTYKVTFTIVVNVGSIVLAIGGSNAQPTVSSSGTYSFTSKATLGDNNLYFSANSDFIGSIDNVSVKEVLGQEVVPDSGCGSWLLEPQSTNLETKSNSFSTWNTLVNVTATSNYIVSPDGTSNATRLQFTSNGYVWNTGQDISSTLFTISCYAKRNNTGTQNVGFFVNGSGVVNSAWAITSEWKRFTYTYTSTNESKIGIAGESGADVSVFGFQIEKLGSYATSYIPTNGATNTRLQDIANNSGNSSLINSTEGVLYGETAALADGGSNRVIRISDGGGNTNVIEFRYAPDGHLNYDIWVGGVSQFSGYYTSFTQTNENKIAIKYKENDFALWVNGAEIATDTSGVTFSANTLDDLSFSRGSQFNFYGKNKTLAVYKEALTDANLRCLTYPNPVATTFDLDFDTIAEQFTFTRGSEATFVNEQGLIESTNQIGPELVTNGDFATDSDWLKGTGWSIANGKASCDGTQTGWSILQQNNILPPNGSIVKIVATISNYSSGILYLKAGYSEPGLAISSNGTFTTYRVVNGSSQFRVQADLNFIGSVDNVSVKEVTTATNTPRIDYSTGEKAFLLEPQSTNLITYSEDFSNSYWAKSSVTLTSGFLAPDGSNNAYKVEGTIGTSYLGNLTANTHLRSIYVRTVSGTGKVKLLGNTTLYDVTEQWTRVSFNPTSNTYQFAVDFRGGTDISEVLIWGAQVEALPYATSYIPTKGASATRNQELCNNATPVINSEEGTLYVETQGVSKEHYSNVSLTDGSNSQRVQIYFNKDNLSLMFFIRVNGALVGTHTVPASGINYEDINKIAIKYRTNDMSFWLNGTKVGTDTSGTMFSPNTLTKLAFNSGSGGVFFGNTKDLKYYPKALADVQLEDLTTI